MIWLDAHLSPRIARWIRETLGHEAEAIRDEGLRDAEDATIFQAARAKSVVLLTKDKDFADLVSRFGPPPTVIWFQTFRRSSSTPRPWSAAAPRPWSLVVLKKRLRRRPWSLVRSRSWQALPLIS